MSQERPQSNNLKVHLGEISTTQHARVMPWATYEPELTRAALLDQSSFRAALLGQPASGSFPEPQLDRISFRVLKPTSSFLKPQLDRISFRHPNRAPREGGGVKGNDMKNVNMAVTSPLPWTTRSPAWSTRHSEADLTQAWRSQRLYD
ncbi:hypothetical protein BHM03_00051548 [Ensete ventricosum]|uniref:Uncharacterized protein n=1 Tax=Ensete ventricosum TaxID=4639 RepID=A0A445MM11_ENSVE|nr:hypothetical protein BHM03_00051548 [Ensete ventricosum]